MKLSEILTHDYKRYGYKSFNLVAWFKVFFISFIPGLQFITVFRAAQFYYQRNWVLFAMFFLWYRRLKVKYGFDISFRAKIGQGFFLGHFGGVVVHSDAVIGDYCNLSQGVTIGISNRGEKQGTPVIGNYVFIGPGAKIFGKIFIGNYCAIGANAVLLNSIEDSAVAVGIPARVVSREGSASYIHNID